MWHVASLLVFGKRCVLAAVSTPSAIEVTQAGPDNEISHVTLLRANNICREAAGG